MFGLLGNAVGDYHRDTAKVSGVVGNTRCSSKEIVQELLLMVLMMIFRV